MPTILELFKSSGLDKQVKPDKDTVIEQELTGIRVRSAVELNNPLIYGNQAIRIATRSTSAVELMKSGTGGEGADGGLIGQGLGAITGGGFGQGPCHQTDVDSDGGGGGGRGGGGGDRGSLQAALCRRCNSRHRNRCHTGTG